jgi:DNA-binding response OmpR family regulator
MSKILIIEDDQEIQNLVRVLMTQNGYESVSAYSGTEGEMVFSDDIDLVLLDIMLPGKSGKEVISSIKAKKEVPVIIMSALGDINSKVDLFALGADDYITKPFHNDELIARIRARLKNTVSGNGNTEKVIKIRNLEVYPSEFKATVCGKDLDLSKQEFELLNLLACNAGKTCTKSMIFEKAWHYDSEADDNTINVHVSKVRKKMKDLDPDNEYISTVWGIGYRILTDE